MLFADQETWSQLQTPQHKTPLATHVSGQGISGPWDTLARSAGCMCSRQYCPGISGYSAKRRVQHACVHASTVLGSQDTLPSGGCSMHVFTPVLYWDLGILCQGVQHACVHASTVLGWSEYFSTYDLVWYNSYTFEFLCYLMASLDILGLHWPYLEW